MANFQELARKKIAGVPVIYLAGGFVVILAVVAYKMKSTNTGATDTTQTEDTNKGAAPTPNPYDSIDPDGTGTVTVVQGPPSADTNTDPVVKTNSTWVSEGAQYLVASKSVPGTAALAALNKYINGQDRSYDEDQWVNAVIKEKGPPPDGTAEGGKVGYKPAVKQFPVAPGVHVVKGGADNTYGDLATLYYGHNDQASYDLIQAANPSVGLVGPFAPGTKVNIPGYHVPAYYNVPTNSMTSTQIAAKNGTTVYAIEALNNTSKTTWSKGSKVRVK
jgi:hypothetical protein